MENELSRKTPWRKVKVALPRIFRELPHVLDTSKIVRFDSITLYYDFKTVALPHSCFTLYLYVWSTAFTNTWHYACVPVSYTYEVKIGNTFRKISYLAL